MSKRVDRETLARFERLFARALLSRDPARSMHALSRNRSLPTALRKLAARASPDGVRIAALLVAKLRFERLVRGNASVADWLERDAAGFAESFRLYEAEVAPGFLFPRAEADAFQRWLRTRAAPLS